MARFRRRFPEPLGKLLEKEMPTGDAMREARVFGAFARAVPPRVLENARPVRFQHGVLFVNAKNAAWAQELEFLGAELLLHVRARLPGMGIKAIRFRVGPLPELPDLPAPEPPKAPRVPLAQLPEDLGRVLAGVRDDGVRQAVAEAARHCLARSDEDESEG